MITTANINRIDRDTLASLLLSPSNVDALAIVDVRDSGITTTIAVRLFLATQRLTVMQIM